MTSWRFGNSDRGRSGESDSPGEKNVVGVEHHGQLGGGDGQRIGLAQHVLACDQGVAKPIAQTVGGHRHQNSDQAPEHDTTQEDDMGQPNRSQ
jgi:hypothetical protein